jgi:mono/diheme cytochrome c family protein
MPHRDAFSRATLGRSLSPAAATRAALRFAAGSILSVAVFAAGGTSARAAGKIDFSREIRPLLSSNCFGCHGPDAGPRKAGLRLDTKAGAFADLEGGGRAIVPGKPGESELYRRLTSDDPDEKMPPPKTGKKLTRDQLELVRRWIESGAEWSQHWAYVPPERPAIPTVREGGWLRGEIDALVAARLDREQIKPSQRADKTTLLRRATLDLIGLPPTIEEVDAFLADPRPDAYERQIDRLLASPHYGERWGRLWLDAARYADSDGYEKDKSRQVWFYRDWVTNALNRDLPYDQFVLEQIAGDELPHATQDQVVATGFLRNSMLNEEGGVDPEQFRMEAMFDRMDAIGKSILGLTIQCAQCHDHKYDPFTQRDYYRMFAFLNNDHEANAAVYTPEEQQRRAELLRRIAEIEAGLRHRHPDWPARMAKWEESLRNDQPAWTVVTPRPEDLVPGGQKHYLLSDGSILAQGYAPTKHVVEIEVRTDLPRITAFRLELLNDPNLPLGGPGRSIKGTCALTEFEVAAAPLAEPSKKTRVKIASASADVNPPPAPLEAIFDDKSGKRRVTGPIAFAVDGDEKTAWGIDVGPHRRNQPRKAVFVAEKPVEFPGGAIVTFALSQKHGGWNSDDNQNNNLGRYRLSVTGAAGAQADLLPAAVRAILSIPPQRRSKGQVDALFHDWRTTVPEWREANEAIEALWRAHPEGSSQLVLAPRAKPRTTHMLKRGDFLKPDREVTAGVPNVLHPLPPDAPPTRLTFARWLSDRKSPTTARAIVNRIWQTYFGIGIVSTSEDLGSQSEAPSHPELLDLLAVDLMDHGWSLKRLHRRIVTSATYRQASRITPDALARDPYNRLLARGPRQRVEAEIVRDVALAASGLLEERLGGPSVFPPAPAFLFQPPASYGPKVWNEDHGPDRYRRATYTFRYRSVPYPALQTFDAPNGDFSCVRRPRSNTPLQALVSLNEPIFLECARGLALEAVCNGGAQAADRLAYAFRRCLARRPEPEESRTLLELLDKETRRFARKPGEATRFAVNDPKRPPQLPPGTTIEQLAGWTAVSRALLNLDETISKE